MNLKQIAEEAYKIQKLRENKDQSELLIESVVSYLKLKKYEDAKKIISEMSKK